MRKAFGIMLLAAGIAALAYGAFTPSGRAREARVGLLDVTVALGFVLGGLLVRRTDSGGLPAGDGRERAGWRR